MLFWHKLVLTMFHPPCLGARKLRVAALLTSLTLPLLNAGTVRAVVIDDFSTSQAELSLTYPPGDSSSAASVSGAGIVDGERDVAIRLDGEAPVGSGLRAEVAAGLLSHSVDDHVLGATILQWDGPDGSPLLDPTGLGGVDLTAGGTQDALRLRFTAVDGEYGLTIVVFTDAGHASVFGSSGFSTGPHEVVLPFAGFLGHLGGGADFTNVGAITLTLGGPGGPNCCFDPYPDVTLDLVETSSTLFGGSPVEVPTLGGWATALLVAALALLGAWTLAAKQRG
jgi:hypothetical protein